MIVIAGFLGGAVTGGALALKRGGRWLDAAQYAAGFGIAFALVGMFATILLERML